MTQNFQDAILGVYQVHPWRQGWPCPRSVLSGTLNVLHVPPWRTPHSWHKSNKDVNMKVLGYLPLGQTRSSMASRMRLSSKSPFRNPQRPPSTPMKDLHSWHTSNKDIDTKLSEYLPEGQTRSFMTSRMTLSSKSPVRNPQCPPSPPLLDPPFLTHF